MMPSATSQHRRRPSSISITATRTPSALSRRSSNHSASSRRSSRHFGTGNGDETPGPDTPLSARDFGSSAGAGAHDTLADELEQAWDDENVSAFDVQEEGDASQLDGSLLSEPSTLDHAPAVKIDTERIRDSGVDVLSPHEPASKGQDVTAASRRLGHSRASSKVIHAGTQPSRTEADTVDDGGFSKSLLRSMKEVEDLAAHTSHMKTKPSTIPEEDYSVRPDTEMEDTRPTSPVARLTSALQSLGLQQNNLELSATRLITAHTSLTAHLAHQTRLMASTTYFFLSPLPSQPLLDLEQIESILPALGETIASLPQPTVDALSSMDRLIAGSRDAVGALSSLSDAIHMTRQTTADASRKMKATKDMAADLRREYQHSDDARDWLNHAGWDVRLEQRRCKAECADIVGGFEEVCEGWRRRLFGHGQVGVV